MFSAGFYARDKNADGFETAEKNEKSPLTWMLRRNPCIACSFYWEP
jgi:hypothetical protein